AAGTGEMVGMIEGMKSLLRLAGRVELRIHRRGELNFGWWSIDRGIPAQVSLVERKMEQRIAVVAAEPVAFIIAVTAKFAHAGLQLDQSLIGLDAEIMALKIDALAGPFRLGDAAAEAIGAIELA